MAKQFNTRVQNKIDTYEHWALAQNFKPLSGEIIIFTPDLQDEEDKRPVKLKIGNGEDFLKDLDFIDGSKEILIFKAETIEENKKYNISEEDLNLFKQNKDKLPIYLSLDGVLFPHFSDAEFILTDPENIFKLKLNLDSGLIDMTIISISSLPAHWNNIIDRPENLSQFNNDLSIPEDCITEEELEKEINTLESTMQVLSNLNQIIDSNSTAVTYPSSQAVYQYGTKIQEIAEGKCKSYVFDTYETLYATLTGKDLSGAILDETSQEKEERLLFISNLRTGDVLLIRELEVPDYWWEKQDNMVFLQQHQKDIIVDSYGAARVLETAKVSLTDYALKTDLVSEAKKAEWDAKSNFSGSYNNLTDIPTVTNGLTPNINAQAIGGYQIRIVPNASPLSYGEAGYITFVL